MVVGKSQITTLLENYPADLACSPEKASYAVNVEDTKRALYITEGKKCIHNRTTFKVG